MCNKQTVVGLVGMLTAMPGHFVQSGTDLSNANEP